MRLKEILASRKSAQETQPRATEQSHGNGINQTPARQVFPELKEKEMEYGGLF